MDDGTEVKSWSCDSVQVMECPLEWSKHVLVRYCTSPQYATWMISGGQSVPSGCSLDGGICLLGKIVDSE